MVRGQETATESWFRAGAAIFLDGVALVGQGGAATDLVGVPGRAGRIKEGGSEF